MRLYTEDDADDFRQERADYHEWKRHQYDDTPVEYHHYLRTTWADYEKAVREAEETDA